MPGPQIEAESAILICLISIAMILAMTAIDQALQKREAQRRYKQKDAFVRELRK
jgi:hypothetical protein